MSKYIHNLIQGGEHQRLDFKFEISDARKIARTLVAFSNAAGGKLLIGVKDNGKIAGIRSEEEMYMLDTAADLYVKPEIKFQCRKWTVDGKTILEADIPEGNQKPYLCRTENNSWMAFIRIDDQNILADIVQLKAWKMMNRKLGILLRYTENEQRIMDQLNESIQITLDNLKKNTGLKRRTIIEVLARLVAFNLIEIGADEKGNFYQLKNISA